MIIVSGYILTDFINGLTHMYMDNNTRYKSIFGPFIAVFHLHHKQPLYKNKHPLVIYYLESGAKFWLIFYLITLLYLQQQNFFSIYLNVVCVAIGILSSVAEVSHYWCHNSCPNNYVIQALQNSYILLPEKHHMKHHLEDNKNYAFLNGISDPLINVIAYYMYPGYKAHADQHVLGYHFKQTRNR